MCCFEYMNNCCNRPYYYNRENCCGCRPRCNIFCNNRPNNVVNNIISSMEIAQFTATTTTVADGANVLFTGTIFNNSSGDITLGGGGVVTLTPGVYKVDYYATVNNTSDAAVETTLGITVNGTANLPSQSTVTIPATSIDTLAGSTVLFVGQGGVSNVALTNLSTAGGEPLNIVRANMVITKIS